MGIHLVYFRRPLPTLHGRLFLEWCTTRHAVAVQDSAHPLQAGRSIAQPRQRGVYMGRRAAKIANRKSKSDQIKTKLFAGFGKKLISAVKAGGNEPETNRALANLIKEAKSQGVPQENINKAILRGTSADAADYKELVYEAYGYGGAGLIINCLTDNPNRAKTEINNVIKKTDVKLASTGAVAFNFQRRGVLELAGACILTEDEILEAALEADVNDVKVEHGNDRINVFTEPASVASLRDALESRGTKVDSVRLANIPHNYANECSKDAVEQNLLVIEALEEIDDVASVDHNFRPH